MKKHHNQKFPSAVAVGHLCSDTICVVDGYPPENTSKHIDFVDKQAGGGASQAIVAYSRLGGYGGYIGNLGNDDVGLYLLEGLETEHVDVRHVSRKEGMSAFSFVFVNSQNASRTLINYHDQLPAIVYTPEVEQYIANATYLHLDGTNYENAMQAALIAKRMGTIVSLDGSSLQKDNAKNRELAKMADILITSEVYPCIVMEDDNLERALLKMSNWGARIVMATLGKNGSVAIVDGKLKYFPTFSEVTPVDTTGCGDVFHGAFLKGLELGYDFGENVRFASAVSSINCMHLGGRNGIPSYSQTIEFIRNRRFG